MSVWRSDVSVGAGTRNALVERETELRALRRQLSEAQQSGVVILIEAALGMGKTRLLDTAQDLARESGMLMFAARASELEAEFPFGVALQLFEPWWISLADEQRSRLCDGPARWAANLLRGGFDDLVPFSEQRGYAVIHSLFWLARSLALPQNSAAQGAVRPVAMFVDDVHWSDGPSLRFLAYLARRISSLPIALLVTVRQGWPTSERQALATLRSCAGDAVLRPGRLSEEGVASLVSAAFPDAEAPFWQACASLTSGNPLLLANLLEQVRSEHARPDAATVARLTRAPPEAVVERIAARLASLTPEAAAVASAVAALGDGASLRHVAAVAGTDFETASHAADTLARMNVLRRGAPLSFLHPLIASAISASVQPLDKALMHRRAATVLAADHAPEEEVAAHLLASTPQSDRRTIEVLRIAARKKIDNGDPEDAVRMLNRALAEQPPAELRPELLAELAEAEMACDLGAAALEHLEAAISATEEEPRRGELTLSKARALYEQVQFRAAAATAEAASAMTCERRPAFADEVDAIFVRAATLVPELTEQLRRRRQRLIVRAGDSPTPEQRDALTHIAVHAAQRGEARSAVVRLVETAWSDGALLEDKTAGDCWPLLAGALLFVDELERAVKLCDAALMRARTSANTAEYATVSYCRAWLLYEQGSVADAAAEAQKALDARPGTWHLHLRTAQGASALSQLQRGELERAGRTLTILEAEEIRACIHYPSLLDVRAQLRLARRAPEEALGDALEAGQRLRDSFGIEDPGPVAWRSTAALAHLALGNAEEAKRLAAEELEHARRIGLRRVVIRDLRVLGLAEGGERGIALLRDAVEAGEAHPPRLEYFHALVDLGAALRRTNQRAAAREVLRTALELCHRGGAKVLEQRAKTELAATGARPRRTMLSGINALTPSQRRVSELAAQGRTTRQIADELFIAPKTVEYHLRQIYMKLSVSSRDQLAQALAAERR